MDLEKTPRSIEMHTRSVRAFSDDGHLSVDELDDIVDAGVVDGAMGAAEKQVLMKVISRLTAGDLTPQLWSRIETLIDRFELDEVV